MTKITLTIILFVLMFPVLVFANESLEDEINVKVTQLAAMMGNAYSHEYSDYRGIQMLRNDKGDITIAVAIFTIEGLPGGGNNYTQYMAVFAALSTESEGHPRRMSLLDVMSVGGKGLRGIEFKNIKMKQSKVDIIITVPTAEYGPNDAMCCPSIKSEAQFIINPDVGGRLKEITRKTKQ